MAVNTVTIKGYIKDGVLEYELPENVIEGEAEITVPIVADEDDLTAEELVTYLKFKGLPLGEIEVPEHEKDPYHLESAVIVRLMRTSIWDICRMVQRELED